MKTKTFFSTCRSALLWERLSVTVLALGLLMLMQPWSMALFNHSFSVVLLGVVLFSVAVKLPQD